MRSLFFHTYCSMDGTIQYTSCMWSWRITQVFHYQRTMTENVDLITYMNLTNLSHLLSFLIGRCRTNFYLKLEKQQLNWLLKTKDKITSKMLTAKNVKVFKVHTCHVGKQIYYMNFRLPERCHRQVFLHLSSSWEKSHVQFLRNSLPLSYTKNINKAIS